MVAEKKMYQMRERATGEDMTLEIIARKIDRAFYIILANFFILHIKLIFKK